MNKTQDVVTMSLPTKEMTKSKVLLMGYTSVFLAVYGFVFDVDTIGSCSNEIYSTCAKVYKIFS
jgi:hypothetical protein